MARTGIGLVVLTMSVGVACAAPRPSGPDALGLSGLSSEPDRTFLGPVAVTWRQEAAGTVWVEYEVDGAWQRTPDLAGRRGENRATVIGVPLGTRAPWRITDGATVLDAPRDLVLGDPPDDLPQLEIEIDEPGWSGDYVLLPINADDYSEAWLIVVDRAGRPVWVAGARKVLYADVAGDHLLWGDIGPDVARTAHLDQPLGDVAMPGYYHTMVELPDGTLAWPDAGALWQRAPGGEPTLVWAGAGWPHQAGFDPDIQMPYFNGLDYDTGTDTFVLGEYYTDALITVDRSSRTASWWTRSQNPDYPADGDGWTFADGTPALQLQHGVQVLPGGNLLVSTVRDERAVVAELAPDPVARQVREVRALPSGVGPGHFAWVEQLPGGNVLHTLGRARAFTEYAPDGTLVWRAFVERGPSPVGRAQVIDDLYALVASR